MNPRNWIAVACAEHARRGRDAALARAPASAQLWPTEPEPVCSGFMQVCHGKAAPLRRLHAGDRVAYYAPTVTLGGKMPYQHFVSIGRVLPGDPYPFDMGGGFVPYRRDVAYVPAQEAPIQPLLDHFAFVQDRQRWGYQFRFGLFEVPEADMRLIARAMQADEAGLGLA